MLCNDSQAFYNFKSGKNRKSEFLKKMKEKEQTQKSKYLSKLVDEVKEKLKKVDFILKDLFANWLLIYIIGY